MKCGGVVRHYLIAAFLIGLMSISASAAFAFTCPTTPSLPSTDGSQPPNIGVLKLQLIDYKCFGAYDRDIAKILTEAMAYVDERGRRTAAGEQLAIVLDIDETSVSNWVNLSTDDFGFFLGGECSLQPTQPCGFDRWIADQNPDVIQPTLDLFMAAKAKGIKVFFVSARREDQRSATIGHLTKTGYRDWDDLILKKPGDPPQVAKFKTAARAAIEAIGYRIIANVGDQYSDLAGGHAERTFKVPNPFYFIP
jgi:hypothetical protein